MHSSKHKAQYQNASEKVLETCTYPDKRNNKKHDRKIYQKCTRTNLRSNTKARPKKCSKNALVQTHEPIQKARPKNTPKMHSFKHNNQYKITNENCSNHALGQTRGLIQKHKVGKLKRQETKMMWDPINILS